MSDSEDDLLSNNASSYQSGPASIYVKGPNDTTVSGFSFPNNFLSSTRNMLLYNMKQAKHGTIKCNQRNSYYRREGSPMSVSKLQDLRPQNFYNHFPGQNHRSYQQSVYSGRGVSPVSVRSIDSTASVSAAEIALAFKNANYNKNDIRLIREAYNKYLKCRSRRRIEKRRNLKLFLKNTRRKCGEDSGDLGSDSSISSDDCRSTRTAPFKEKLLKYKANKDRIINLQTTINENNLYNDCTENLRQNYLRHMLNTDSVPNSRDTNTEKTVLLKDRFKKGFSYPAQRFNKCPQLSTEPESSRIKDRKMLCQDKQITNSLSCDLESEQEEIFSEITTIERNLENSKPHKRHNDSNELHTNQSKKSKMPKTQLQNGLDSEMDCDNNDKINFVFAKPKLPLKKPGKIKGKTSKPEILIPNSCQPPTVADQFINSSFSPKISQSSHVLPKQTEINDKLEKIIVNNIESMKENLSNNDVSLRSSFIKRKLFTQKLDIAENKNLCNTSQHNSPQTKSSANNKEKNKTRKIASSQSCLSRDVLVEDSNIKNLIQKIVPSDGITISSAANRSQACNRKSQPDADDKWDISSVISTCNTNQFSDTYTDEEIFNPVKVANKSKSNPNKVQSNLNANCSIVLKKLPKNFTNSTATNNNKKDQNVTNGMRKDDAKKKPSLPQKSFWDTDLDSDFDNNSSLPRNLNLKKMNSIASKIEEDRAKSTNNNNNSNKTKKVEVNLITTETKQKRTAAMKTTQTQNKGGNSKNVEKGTKTPQRKKKGGPDNEHNVSSLSNRSLRSIRRAGNLEKEENLYKNFNTVTLINHRVLRSKRIEKKNTQNNNTSCEMISLDGSNELNISTKSLRSWRNQKKK